MKNKFLIIPYILCIISFLPTYDLSAQTNQMEWTNFETLSSFESNLVVNVKDSIAQHLADSFKGLQYKCASLILDNQSWVQSQENGMLKFSGRLNFNKGVLSEQQFETANPFPRIQGGGGAQVVLSFPTPRGGISGGDLYGMLYIEDANGFKRKFSVGPDKAMRISFGPKLEKP